MLYDTDMVNMVGAITPTDEKLLSKGVASVRQRIALLKDFISLDIEEFKSFVRNNLCQGELTLNEEDVRGIEEIEKEYLTEEFVYGNNPKYTLVRKKRIETVGDIELRIEVKNRVIKGMAMLGDYFIVGDIDGDIINRQKGVEMVRDDLRATLPERLNNTILNLKKDDFIDIILNQNS